MGVNPEKRPDMTRQPDDPSDLTFFAGDIIDINEEANADWWNGTVRGRTGLFPSSYVERIAPYSAGNEKGEKPAYRPFGAALHGTGAPTAAVANGLQPDPEQDKKKNKFGKYKETVSLFPYIYD